MRKRFGFIGFFLFAIVKLFTKSLPIIDTKNKNRLEFFLKFSALILYAWSKKIWVIPYSIYRTAEQQNDKWKLKQSDCDGFVKISKHQLWRAGDILILNPDFTGGWKAYDEYLKLALFWEAMNGTWGYRWYEKGLVTFKDYYHYEI